MCALSYNEALKLTHAFLDTPFRIGGQLAMPEGEVSAANFNQTNK